MCRQEIEKMMAIVVRGDALNQTDVQKAFDQIEEVDAVVSTIGGTPGDPLADSQVQASILITLCKHHERGKGPTLPTLSSLREIFQRSTYKEIVLRGRATYI